MSETTYIAIVGTRSFTDEAFLFGKVDRYILAQGLKNVTIVSGGAAGADSLGADYARSRRLGLIVHEAQWHDLEAEPRLIRKRKGREYNVLAGHNRNTLIVNDSDHVLAFFVDKKTNGTMNTVNKARKAGKPVAIFSTHELKG